MLKKQLTSHSLREGLNPGIHLNELDVVQNLIHLLNALVSHGYSLPPEVLRQPGANIYRKTLLLQQELPIGMQHKALN